MGKKRQAVRKAFIITSFLLFPITIFYLSPVVPIGSVIERVFSGSLILFTSLFLFSLLFGRLFCSWACPGGGLGEICFAVNNKRQKSTKLSWLKFIWWTPWLTLLIVMSILNKGFYKIDPLYNTFYGISISEPWMYIIYYSVVGLIVIISISAGKRAFCHYVCWMAPFMIIGEKVRKLLNIPALHLKTDSSECINCRQCDKQCVMSLEVSKLVSNGSITHSECILCGECKNICPKDVIKFSFGTTTKTSDKSKEVITQPSKEV